MAGIIYSLSGGKIYGDSKVYPPSGGKIYPGTAYPSGLNPAWPFSDIPLPPFLWRPDLTGDYTNVGSDGAALDLTPAPDNPFNPQGYPPPLGSFNQGWVISNPTGNESSVAIGPYNPDVSDLGGLFSLVFRIKGYGSIDILNTNYNPPLMNISYNNGSPLTINIFNEFGVNQIQVNGTLILNDGVEYTIIITFNAGVLHLYINGNEDPLVDNGSVGSVTSLPDTGLGICIGDDWAYPDGPSGDGSVLMIEAIAKGIEYTPAQAAEITNTLNPTTPTGNILLENGSYLLLETGDHILLEA